MNADNDTTKAFNQIYKHLCLLGGQIIQDAFEILNDYLIDQQHVNHDFGSKVVDVVLKECKTSFRNYVLDNIHWEENGEYSKTSNTQMQSIKD